MQYQNNMMASYFYELQGEEYYEIPNMGFFTYKVMDKEFHIPHYYVVPEKRKNLNTVTLGAIAEKLAKERGCTYITGLTSVGTQSPKITSRLCKIYLDFGFKIIDVLDKHIIFKKDLI